MLEYFSIAVWLSFTVTKDADRFYITEIFILFPVVNILTACYRNDYGIICVNRKKAGNGPNLIISLSRNTVVKSGWQEESHRIPNNFVPRLQWKKSLFIIKRIKWP